MLLGNTVDFSFGYGKQKLLFQPFEVGWLSPKSAAILARPKHPSDVTSCVTLMPSWKFRVIMGEENTLRSPPKSFLRTFQSCKADNNSSLRHEEVESRSWGFSVYLIGYFQDISRIFQANACKFLNHKMIGILGQMASTHLNNIYSRKVKKIWKQEKRLFKILSGVLLHESQQQRFEFSTRFALRKPDALWVKLISPRTRLCFPVTLVQLYLLHPRGYHNSNHLRNPLLLYGGSEFKIIKG